MKIYIAGKITGESRASVAEKFASAMWKLILEFIRTLIVSIVFIFFVIASVALLAWLIKEILI